MKLDHIYIISWFGRDPILRDFRKKCHEKQLEWCRTNNLKITVLAQEYNEDEYHPDVEYVTTDTLLRPCGARNTLMERFYNSDEDYAVFADNDTIIVDEEWGKPNGFLEEMRTIPEIEYGKIDFVGGINPAIQAYSDELERPEYVNNIVFRKTRRFSGGFFILKNLQKHKGFKRWFDDESFRNEEGKIIPGEEGDFAINLLMSGLFCFQNYKAVFYDMATANRSTWANSTSERTDPFTFARLINKKYGMELIGMEEESAREFKVIGYVTEDGETKISFSEGKMKDARKGKIKGASFWEAPNEMLVEDLMQWAIANIQDPTMQEILDKNKKKGFKRLSNPRTKFDWKKLPIDHPQSLFIPRKGSKFNEMFS
jgi:hypothetical protein